MAGQAVGRGFRADVIGSGILLEKSFEFADPINRTASRSAGAKQATKSQPVKRGRRAAESLRGLDSVQREFGNDFNLFFFQHATVLPNRMGEELHGE